MALIKSAADMLAELEHLPDDRRTWTREQRATRLTDRQAECLKRSRAGQSGERIGCELGISRRTAYSHVHRAVTKLGIEGHWDRARRGQTLSNQQRLFLSYRAAGRKVAEIAAQCHVTEGCITAQCARARVKLKCESIPETIKRARELGLLFESIAP
jgi:DNA-binding CsgD family transcriptional regulator